MYLWPYNVIKGRKNAKTKKQKVCQSNIIEMLEYFEADAPTSQTCPYIGRWRTSLGQYEIPT